MQTTDQIGNSITITAPPQRIVSLVPSITELLVDFGLEDQLVGVTKFCVHPERIRKEKTIIGGTKNINIDRITELQPDLIIANKEENVKEQVDELMESHTVYVSDITTRAEGIAFVESIGAVVGKEDEATEIAEQLRLRQPLQKDNLPSTLYLIWRKPYMAAGGDTYIHDMLDHYGYANCLHDQHRYHELSKDRIQELNPQVVMLSSEPYPFGEKHITEIQTLLPEAQVVLVDGEAFSWYGTRELKVGRYYEELGDKMVSEGQKFGKI